jgi:hypothetical protein
LFRSGTWALQGTAGLFKQLQSYAKPNWDAALEQIVDACQQSALPKRLRRRQPSMPRKHSYAAFKQRGSQPTRQRKIVDSRRGKVDDAVTLNVTVQNAPQGAATDCVGLGCRV